MATNMPRKKRNSYARNSHLQDELQCVSESHAAAACQVQARRSRVVLVERIIFKDRSPKKEDVTLGSKLQAAQQLTGRREAEVRYTPVPQGCRYSRAMSPARSPD